MSPNPEELKHQDQVNRDRMLERVDVNVTRLLDDHKRLTEAFIDHKKEDNNQFSEVMKRISAKESKDAFFYGKLYGGAGVAGALVTLVMKLLFKI